MALSSSSGEKGDLFPDLAEGGGNVLQPVVEVGELFGDDRDVL